MSGIPSRPEPTPGVPLPVQLRSCVPSALVNGEPRSNPPETVAQFTPSVRPIVAHVVGTIEPPAGPEPAKARYWPAMLREGAREWNWVVSYQPCAVVELCSGLVSILKKKKILFFQIGPPMLPP